jgi:hypothetical protein
MDHIQNGSPIANFTCDVFYFQRRLLYRLPVCLLDCLSIMRICNCQSRASKKSQDLAAKMLPAISPPHVAEPDMLENPVWSFFDQHRKYQSRENARIFPQLYSRRRCKTVDRSLQTVLVILSVSESWE